MTGGEPTSRPWVVNASASGWWPGLRIGELWRHRELIGFFAVRDVKVRYKQALLGVAWAGVQPVVGAVVFFVVFHRLADVDVGARSYFAFAVLGTGVWTYFSVALQNGTASLLANADLLTKVSFPRLVIPAATLLPGMIELTVAMVIAVVAALAAGGGLSAVGLLVGVPAGLALLVLGAAGPVLWFSASVVRYRDVLALVGFGTQLLLFASPIAYPPEFVPEGWRTLLFVNPVAGAVGLLRWGLVGAPAPGAAHVALSVGVATALFVTGLVHFRRHERTVADVI